MPAQRVIDRVVPGRIVRGLIPCALLTLTLAGCDRPSPPPPPDNKPDPQATQLRDAIQAPLDKAHAVEDQVRDAAEKQRAQIEAQGG